MRLIELLLASTISPMNMGKIKEAKLDRIRNSKPNKYMDLYGLINLKILSAFLKLPFSSFIFSFLLFRPPNMYIIVCSCKSKLFLSEKNLFLVCQTKKMILYLHTLFGNKNIKLEL